MSTAETNEDASDAFGQSPHPDEWEELTDEQRAGYEKTLAQSQAVVPILDKIEAAAQAWDDPTIESVSIRIKPEDCYTLMGWIINLQNIGDLLSERLNHAMSVIGSQEAALAEYEAKTGKKLWIPGPT